MTLGQVVDYCEAWNKRNTKETDANGREKPRIREATQADWDAFWG